MAAAWPAMLPPLAALITLALAKAVALVSESAAGADSFGVAPLLIMMPVPLVVAVLWGCAALGERHTKRILLAFAGWLVAGYLLLTPGDTWQMTANVAAGLLAGTALRRAWRLDAALAGVVLALLPLIVWAAVQMPVREQLKAVTDQSLEALEREAPAGTDPVQIERAVESGRRRFEQVADLTARLYPSLIGAGLLGQAVIILLLVRLSGRWAGFAPRPWGLPPFPRWRLPFYLVWLLAIGIGLMVTRRAPLADAGLNLAVLTAAVLSVQGLAVQFHISRRLMSPVGLVIYWTMMGLVFVPLAVSSVALGLADQWWDLRRLNSGASTAGE